MRGTRAAGKERSGRKALELFGRRGKIVERWGWGESNLDLGVVGGGWNERLCGSRAPEGLEFQEATTVAPACCRGSFEEPILDAPWKTQGSLTPLLKCFPRDIWTEEGGCLVSPLTAFVPPAIDSKKSQQGSDESRMG